MQTGEGYIGLVRLSDYYRFVQDENGDLSRRIFESNVRGWQPSTPVNSQIRQSLEVEHPVNFWLLNNGITILSSKAGTVGGLKKLGIQDPQIVNGLQTSRAIYNYFHDLSPAKDERTVLVRVIETEDEDVYDQIIKATNSQNTMQPASLAARGKSFATGDLDSA